MPVLPVAFSSIVFLIANFAQLGLTTPALGVSMINHYANVLLGNRNPKLKFFL